MAKSAQFSSSQGKTGAFLLMTPGLN